MIFGVLFKEIVVKEVSDVKNVQEMVQAVKPSLASKQYGNQDFLTQLVVNACLEIMPKGGKGFNVDSVRVVKILGSGLHESRVVRGMVFPREAESLPLFRSYMLSLFR